MANWIWWQTHDHQNRKEQSAFNSADQPFQPVVLKDAYRITSLMQVSAMIDFAVKRERWDSLLRYEMFTMRRR